MYRLLTCFSKISLLIALCVTCVQNVQAQSGTPGFGIEANLISGKIIRHTAKITGPIPEHPFAVEVNLAQQTFGKQPWHQRWNYPMIGLGIMYTDYGIDSVYGKCIGMYPNLQIPLVRGKNLEWTFRVGFGIGYVTRKYERYPSYDTFNTAIGSHFNNFTAFSTDLRYHLSNHLDLQLGANFSHMSNAALKQPNLGLNMYGAHIGLRYFPATSRPEKIYRKLKPLKSRWLLQARYSMAFSESGYADGPVYPVYMGSAFVSKRWRSKFKALAGIDYSYHTRIEAFQKNNFINPGEEKENSWKSAVFVGNEFLTGRVGILLQVGVYLKDAALHLDPYYQKLGLNLYLLQREQGFMKEVFISGILKTHKTQAELAEFGIGIGL